jgi:hypothetical protein
MYSATEFHTHGIFTAVSTTQNMYFAFEPILVANANFAVYFAEAYKSGELQETLEKAMCS